MNLTEYESPVTKSEAKFYNRVPNLAIAGVILSVVLGAAWVLYNPHYVVDQSIDKMSTPLKLTPMLKTTVYRNGQPIKVYWDEVDKATDSLKQARLEEAYQLVEKCKTLE